MKRRPARERRLNQMASSYSYNADSATPPAAFGGGRLRNLLLFDGWARPTGQLHIFTSLTKHEIPSAGGCYAWFLPLWILHDDLGVLLEVVNRIFRYEQDPERKLEASFTWERVGLRVNRGATVSPQPASVDTWNRLLEENRGRSALERVLLEASLLMPPLYVGRARDLRTRYNQHVRGGGDKNTFHNRFRDCLSRLGREMNDNRLEGALAVEDLLFVCVTDASRGDDGSEGTASERSLLARPEVEGLIEEILMTICRPPFSLKGGARLAATRAGQEG